MNQNCNNLRDHYFRYKLVRAAACAAFFDTILILFIPGIVLDAIDWISQHLLSASLFDDDSPDVTAAIRATFLIYGAIYFTNTLMILSPWRATVGMKTEGMYLESYNGQHPSFMQAVRLFLFSPLLLPFVCVTVYVWVMQETLNGFHLIMAIPLMWGMQAVLIMIYTLIFGGVLEAREKLAGLKTKFSLDHLEKLNKKFTSKESSIKRQLALHAGFTRSLVAIFLAVMLYLPALWAADFLRKPTFDYSMYAPYKVNWGADNAYFALIGLSAPDEVLNSYEFGKSRAYRDFMRMEQIKQRGKIPHRFDVPYADSFEIFDLGQPGLVFQPLKSTRGEEKDFGCIFDMGISGPSQECASTEDVQAAIETNIRLWRRFDALPSYDDFSVPPEATWIVPLDEYFSKDISLDVIFASGQEEYHVIDHTTLVWLGQLKAAQIVLMQQEGHSEAALQEWAKFMNLYRQMAGSRTGIFNRASAMILIGEYSELLETLLYRDPDLAVRHFDRIDHTLNPQGLKMYRGSSLLADSFSALEPLLLSETGRATGVQNIIHACIEEQAQLAALSAREFFKTDAAASLCPALNSRDMSDLMFDLVFRTTGNGFYNLLWSLMYSSEIKAVTLIDNMHIQDAELRMASLGALIIHQKVAADQVSQFIQDVPAALQNPIEEAPFHWDEQGSYLWFDPPKEGMARVKFHLSL